MKKKYIIAILVICMLLCSCYSENEQDETVVESTAAVDQTESNETVMEETLGQEGPIATNDASNYAAEEPEQSTENTGKTDKPHESEPEETTAQESTPVDETNTGGVQREDELPIG